MVTKNVPLPLQTFIWPKVSHFFFKTADLNEYVATMDDEIDYDIQKKMPTNKNNILLGCELKI